MEVGGIIISRKGKLMPRKPKHPCGYPGCPELTDKRYCLKHQRLVNRQYEKYDRDPVTQARYGYAWRKIRYIYTKEHPFCEECLKAGRFVPVEQVHHIRPLAEGGTNDEDNLISLCMSCHSHIHAKRGDRWRKQKG